MKRIKYVGPHDAVDVPVAGLEGVERGKPVELDDELAAALLEQVDNWQPVQPPSKRAASKKAAAKPAAAGESTEG